VNSVEKPVNGERCRPAMNPSTTARATNSNAPMRASTSGSRKRAGPGAGAGVAPVVATSVSTFFFRHHITQLLKRRPA
jgi:hypothetical protein